MIAGACPTASPIHFAKALDRAARTVGVNFIGGYSALVHKGFGPGDYALIESIPQALDETELVCSSVNVGTTKAGINMDAVEKMGRIVKGDRPAHRPTGSASARPSWWCSATPPRTTPLWRAPSTAPASRTASSNVGVSGPGVVRAAIKKHGEGKSLTEIAELIKRTAFKITRMGQLVAQEASRRLCVPFGIVDLSLGPHPRPLATSVAYILEGMGLEQCGAPRHHRRLGPFKRRGEEGRRHGQLQRRRAFRRLYPRHRGRRHD